MFGRLLRVIFFFQNVVWEQDNNNKSLIKPLVALELNGDGQPKLMLYGRAFADNFGMRSIHISGFAEVTIQRQGLRVRNPVDTNFSININKVRRLYLKTNAIQPIAGVVDVVLEDCERVWLDSEVVSRLRTFVFRRIKNLQLSENTFKKATDGLAIDTVRKRAAVSLNQSMEREATRPPRPSTYERVEFRVPEGVVLGK